MLPTRSLVSATLVALLLPGVLQAAPSTIVFSAHHKEPVAVRYRTRADYIVLTVMITSGERDAADGLLNIRKAKDRLLEQLGENSQVAVHEGHVHPNLEGGEVLPSSSGIDDSLAHVHVLLPVIRESDNVFSGGAELTRLVSKTTLPGKARYELSPVRLAVEDPEKLRGKILEMIKQHVSDTREKLGGGKVILRGLESPVKVVQVDDINVELFIQYEMTVEVQ